jgi:hypothetical protein
VVIGFVQDHRHRNAQRVNGLRQRHLACDGLLQQQRALQQRLGRRRGGQRAPEVAQRLRVGEGFVAVQRHAPVLGVGLQHGGNA